ncbi:MAG: hypothetical protein KF875_06715 [Trueperaceae bacterium]|nr:hypothetical protein [Trueperaceae bacterium]MCO5173464.1 hypothetical protein [Trueperaceae bacterium]MCW5819691.1 hypothetical protein [Trueperaceae bacterium]
MWLPRLLTALEAADRPVLATGGEEYGVPFLVAALRERSSVAWLELDRGTRGDAVAQGNALAKAVNATLGTSLLAAALPYSAHLAALKHHRDELLPLWLVLTTESAAEPVVGALLGLVEDGYRVLLDLRGEAAVPPELADRCAVLGPDELRVPLAEAELLVPRAVAPAELAGLWRSADGRFTPLIQRAHRLAGLPAISVPAPTGSLVPKEQAQLVDAPLAVQALRREGELIAALELATLKAPELVDDLLRQSGPRFQEEGLLPRLHLLLSALPEAYSRSERVLEWRLVAALAASDLAGVLPDVDAHLAVHIAPDLRARRAGAMPREDGFALAKQAVEARRTPLTLWQYGRLHPDDDVALQVLRESVQLADDAGTPFDLVRNGGMLVARLAQQGDYGQAARWARWVLDVFDRGDVRDGARRLQVVNDLAMASIMTGDLVGVRKLLENATVLAEGGLPQLAALLKGTLAALELVEGRRLAALAHAEENYRTSSRRTRALHGYVLVRVLLELEDFEAARRVAVDIGELVDPTRAHEWAVSRLVQGMVTAVMVAAGAAEDAADSGGGRQAAAADDLLSAILEPSLTAEQRLSAVLHYLLLVPGAVANLPAATAELAVASSAAALRVASGPEKHFASVWNTISRPRPALHVTLLGEPEARYRGSAHALPLRLAEVVSALVLNRDGIDLEALNAYLVPEGKEPFTKSGVRGMMTRLRKFLPISDAPYGFAEPFSADVLALRGHLAKNEVRQAVALYRSGLLPRSSAPGVEEERLALEEELRQAVLESADADALCELAERLGDDLECWEAAERTLLRGDPRLTVARARVRRLRQAYL